MKEYNRITKKYEEATDIKLKKRELCRGGREHDYLLVLPDHVSYNENYKFNPEEYYRIMDELRTAEEMYNKKILEMGIGGRWGSFNMSSRTARSYCCSICKKKKYE